MLGSALGVPLHGNMCIFMAPVEELSLHLACAQTWTHVSAHPQGTPGCNHTFVRICLSPEICIPKGEMWACISKISTEPCTGLFMNIHLCIYVQL